MNRALALVLALGLLVSPAAIASICAFGYTDMMSTKELSGGTLVTDINVNQIFDYYNMNMDSVVWHFAANTEWLPIHNYLNNYVLNRNAKVVLDLTGMLFYRQNGTTTCSGYGGATVSGKDLAFSDWQTRLGEFIDVNGADLVSSKVRMIVIHAEANNACAAQGVIDQIAYYIKYTRGISVPLAEGLPTTYLHSGYHAQPLPTNKPWWIDYILTWSYGVWDPNNPSDARNASQIFPDGKLFFNPSNPSDPNTLWGGLLAWKRPAYKIAWVLDSHCVDFLHYALGWTQCQAGNVPEMGTVASNFRPWLLARPEIRQVYAFSWPSYDTYFDPDLDTNTTGDDDTVFVNARDFGATARSAHQAIANAAFACEP